MPTRGELPDELLLERVRNGEPEVFEQLFRRYLRALETYVRQRLPASVRRKVSVADILQEVRIVALKGVGAFEWRDEASVRNWLLKIANYTVRSKLRNFGRTAKRAADREVTRGGRPETAQFVAGGPSPSEAAAASELAVLAERALRSLPPDYRQVVRLVRQEELTLGEAGARMGRSREAAKKLYRRALSAFMVEFDRLQGTSHG